SVRALRADRAGVEQARQVEHGLLDPQNGGEDVRAPRAHPPDDRAQGEEGGRGEHEADTPPHSMYPSARSRRAVSSLGAIVPPRGPKRSASARQSRRQRSSAARIAAASSGRAARTFSRSPGSRRRSKRRSSGPSTM